MPFTPATVATGGTTDPAPTLSASQRALAQLGFLLNATTGRYEVVNGLTAGTKRYLRRDVVSGRLVIADNDGGSVRMVRLANGRISV